jgi:acetylornithine deacetylase/succinyl-diaminopimelate desuccinylase-like protein
MSYVQNVPLEKIFQIGVSGGTDMGYVTNHELIFHGLGNLGSNLHGVNESVKLKDVKTYIKELIVYLCAEF